MPTIGIVDASSVSTPLNQAVFARVLPVTPPIPFTAGSAISLKWQTSSPSILEVYLQLQF